MTNANTRCSAGNCVAVTLVDDSVLVTSTVPDNIGNVLFTHAEWDQFIADVKAGAWDDTVTQVVASKVSLGHLDAGLPRITV